MNLWPTSDWHLDGSPERFRLIRGLVEEIRSRMLPGDRFCAFGDLTDDGEQREYSQLLELLRPGDLVAPGNHDMSRWGLIPYCGARRRWPVLQKWVGWRQTVDLDEHYTLMLLDSVLYTSTPFDLARGRVGILQRRRVRAQLERCRKEGRRLVIGMHHSLLDRRWEEALTDQKEIEAEWIGKAWAVLMGHEHKARMAVRAGTLLVSLAALKDSPPPASVELPDPVPVVRPVP
jgi:3',5'-cyclic AMP phosphodiesterase CpdA